VISSEQLRGADGPVGTAQVSVTSDAVRITLSGEIDVLLDGELDDAARTVREHQLPVVVDATAVTFMDSTGVRFIGRCYGHGELTVTASPVVRFLLEILAMDDVVAGDD
jgi:anti-anti-sigma factor